MEFFTQLGHRIDDLWRRNNYDEAAFADVATEALADKPPARHVESYDIVRWALRQKEERLPVNNESFGEPPVMLFQGRRFYVEALFWVDGTTSIHQHAFAGAFHVLDGSSIHTEFHYETRQRINDKILLGELETANLEYLNRGETRPITEGQRFIHSLFHLDRPSVTIVVRTPGEGWGPQYSYFRPGLAVDPFFADTQLTKQLKLMGMLLATQPKRALAAARDILRHTDFYGALKLAQLAYHQLEEGAPREGFVALLDEHHGALTRPLVAALDDIGHRARIIDLRKTMTNPEHRFFLALLMNLSSRSEMLAMVAARFPRRDPQEVIMRWMAEITRHDGKAPLPVPFGSGTLEVFSGLLAGTPPSAVARTIAKTGANPKESKQLHSTVVDLCEVFAGSMFRDLLFAA